MLMQGLIDLTGEYRRKGSGVMEKERLFMRLRLPQGRVV